MADFKNSRELTRPYEKIAEKEEERPSQKWSFAHLRFKEDQMMEDSSIMQNSNSFSSESGDRKRSDSILSGPQLDTFRAYGAAIKAYTQDKDLSTLAQNIFTHEQAEAKKKSGRKNHHHTLAAIWSLTQSYANLKIDKLSLFAKREMNTYDEKRFFFDQDLARDSALWFERQFCNQLDLSVDRIQGYQDHVASVLKQISGEEQAEEAKGKLLKDPASQTYPFLMLFFMFRAGDHKTALQYCKTINSADIAYFGEEKYAFYVKHNCALPKSEVAAFL